MCYAARGAPNQLDDDGLVHVFETEQRLGRTGEATLRDLSEALIPIYGTDYGVHSPIWISRFADAARQAAAYRERRVRWRATRRTCITPAGGQGLNASIDDYAA